jgi:hypothetical protein
MIIRRIALSDSSSGWPEPEEPLEEKSPYSRRPGIFPERAGFIPRNPPPQRSEQAQPSAASGPSPLRRRGVTVMGHAQPSAMPPRWVWEPQSCRCGISGKLIVLLLYVFCLLTMMLLTLIT